MHCVFLKNKIYILKLIFLDNDNDPLAPMIDGERLPRLQQQQKVHAHSMFTRIGKKFLFFFWNLICFKFYFFPFRPFTWLWCYRCINDVMRMCQRAMGSKFYIIHCHLINNYFFKNKRILKAISIRHWRCTTKRNVCNKVQRRMMPKCRCKMTIIVWL